jgi:hypothetical protein
MPNPADRRFDSTVDRLRRLSRIKRNAGHHPVGQRNTRRDLYRNLSRRADDTGLSGTS